MSGPSSLERFFEPALRHYNQGNVKWTWVWQFVAIHVVAVYSLTHLKSTSRYTFLFAFALYFLSVLGTTAGVHRLWSHQSYKASLPLQIFLMLCFSLSGSGSIYEWVCKHHSHHKYVDTHGDPHNSSRGFFFSHIGWLLLKERSEVIEAKNAVNTQRLDQDPVVQFNKHYTVWLAVFMSFVLPYLVCAMWGDGLNGLLVAGFLRLVVVFHAIFCVNSFAHLQGDRLYESSFSNMHGLPVHPNACARENTFVALVAMGEGWHNFHHKYPYDYASKFSATHYSTHTHRTINPLF